MPQSFRSRALAFVLAALSAIPAAKLGLAADSFRWLTIDGAAVRWRPGVTAGIVLRYAFAQSTTHTAGAVNCSPLAEPTRLLATSRLQLDSFRAAATEAFARWESATPIKFVAVDDEAKADIVIGEQTVAKGYAFTNLTLGGSHGDRVRPIVRATICLNPLRTWKIGFDGNLASYDLVHTLTHEIGHAIGLDHPGPRGHLMSFRYDEKRDGLSQGDVLGANVIYGSASDPILQRRREAIAADTERARTRDESTLSRALSSARRE